MDKRSFLAIALCFLIFLGYQKLYLEPRMPKTPEQSSTESPPAVQSQSVVQESKKEITPSSRPTQTRETMEKVTLHNREIVVGSGRQFFKDWSLLEYKRGSSLSIDLSSVTNEAGSIELLFDSSDYSYLKTVNGKLERKGDVVYWSYQDEKVDLNRKFQFYSDQPYVDVLVSAKFKESAPKYAFISLKAKSISDDPEALDRQLGYFTEDGLERLVLSDGIVDGPGGAAGIPTVVNWISAMNRYFTLVVMNQGLVGPKGVIQQEREMGGALSMTYPLIQSGLEIPLRVYFGAKDLTTLHKIDPTLDETIDFGIFRFLAVPFLKLLKWLYSYLQNYGLAIVLLTFLVKLATYPLTYKSMKGMKQMQKLQPQLKKLQERYKDDRESLNREMIVFMRKHGYNPMSGCWPILAQMPVFFALYRVLYSSVELYRQPMGLWITDLSTKDPYYVFPVLVTVTWFLQQKISPQTVTDPTQKKILQFMPIMFGVFMITLPSGLGIYFLTNAVLSIFQQMLLNKKFGSTQNATSVQHAESS